MRKSAAFALTLLGLFDSLYLWWVYVSPSRPMVCIGTGCDAVRASRFAHVFGVPLPVFGVALYTSLALLIFGAALLPATVAALTRRLTVVVAGAGLVASVALSAIEAFVIRAWCSWCVVQAIAVTLVFLLSLSVWRNSFPDGVRSRAAARQYITVLMIAIVAGTASFEWLRRRAYAEGQQGAASLTQAEFSERLVRSSSHATGNLQSPVVFLEFGDLQCAACAQVAPTVRELRHRFGDRVRFVFRHFPLDSIHAYALPAAEASECAARQGKFWEAVDRFYQAQGMLDVTSPERYAGELGLDMAKYRACMANKETFPQIQGDVLDGRALGVGSTPTFFVGRRRIVGARALSDFEQMLKDDLIVAGVPGGSTRPSAAPAEGKKSSGDKWDAATSRKSRRHP